MTPLVTDTQPATPSGAPQSETLADLDWSKGLNGGHPGLIRRGTAEPFELHVGQARTPWLGCCRCRCPAKAWLNRQLRCRSS